MTVTAKHFEETVAEYRAMVLGNALRVTNDLMLAEDATQEAFIALYQRYQSAGEPEIVGPWLRKVVRRIARDMVRRERQPIRRVLADRALDDESMPYAGSAAATGPPRTLLDREHTAEALALLAVLPRGDREVLVGLLFEQDSRARLAMQLGISSEALDKRFERATQRLRSAGHRPERLARILGLATWPRSYAERCQRSAEARSAARDALNACCNPVTGMIRLAQRAAFERVYALGARALALDPHDARCHAILTEVCLWLARAEARERIEGPAVRTVETYAGALGGAPLEQALAHARLAEQLAPNEPRVLLAVANTLTATAAAPADIPWPTVITLARRAHRVAPNSLVFAVQYVVLALRQPNTVDWKGLERALRRQRRTALERYDLFEVTGLLTLALGFGHEQRAAWLFEVLRDDLRPAPHVKALYDEALVVMGERLADPEAFRRRREQTKRTPREAPSAGAD